MKTIPIIKKNFKLPLHGGVNVAELREIGMIPDNVVDFSVNVNPLGPPSKVYKVLRDLDFSSYPDIENLLLRETVSQLTGINFKQIVFGNGTMELINLLAQTHLQNGDAVFILSPTFSEYEVAAKRRNAEVFYSNASYSKGFYWDISKITKKIQLSFRAKGNRVLSNFNFDNLLKFIEILVTHFC